MATVSQTPPRGEHDRERRGNEPLTVEALSAAPADGYFNTSARHTCTEHHLAKGALSQDFAELELPRIPLFRPLLHMMSDVDLFDGRIILQHKQTHNMSVGSRLVEQSDSFVSLDRTPQNDDISLIRTFLLNSFNQVSDRVVVNG